MFKPKMNSFKMITGLLWFLTGFTLSGQENSNDPQKSQQQALVYMEEGDFRGALSEFRKLLESSPGNSSYGYYAGRCLVELNEHLDEAIELLYGASISGAPHDVNFYLGLAYHREYNFTDALKYYKRFELKASRQELKEYNIKHLIATCRSAAEITSSYNPYEVINVTFIDLFDSLQFRQVKMKGGHLQRKPASFLKLMKREPD